MHNVSKVTNLSTRLLVLIAALLSLLLMAPSGCGPQPTPNPPPNPPAAQGGTVGSGGSVGLGGTPAEGGSSVVAGAAGSTVAAVVFPACNEVTAKAKPVVRHPLGPKRHAIKGRPRASYQIVGGLRNVFHGSNVDFSTDQGSVGSCTGEAPVQIWATSPFLGTGTFEFLNQLAYDVYSGATKRDNIRGVWPPNDTGSFGVYSMQEMVARGLFSGFKSVQSFAELQELGQTRGCIVGTNWTDTMFAPDRCGQIHVSATVEGGHEWAIVGFDFDKKLVWGDNSWGDDYGVKVGNHGGYFNLTFGDFVRLWNDGGEAECPDLPILSPPN